MVNKRHLHHVWRKLQPINSWLLLGLTIISAVIFIYSYRQNNLKMIELRDKVFAADEANGDIEGALRNLREHVYSHMNTTLVNPSGIRPPIQLTHRYDRLVQQEQKRVDSHNKKVRDQAEPYCLRQVPPGPPGSLQRRAKCVQQYISTNSISAKNEIPKEFYQFDFVSPRWSPDLAGWSMLATMFFGLLFMVRFLLERWLKHEIHSHL